MNPQALEALDLLSRLLPDPTALSWREVAACRTADPMIFFPSEQDSAARRFSTADQAKAVCSECLVINECLQYAIDTNQRDGVWGGLTGKERRKFKERMLTAQRRAQWSPEEWDRRRAQARRAAYGRKGRPPAS